MEIKKDKSLKWIVARASVIGDSHIKDDMLCQDANGYQFFEEENFSISVVSDGAGSAENAEKGAALIVEQVLGKFSQVVKDLHLYKEVPTEVDWQQTTEGTFNAIYMSLKEAADAQNISVESLAATVIVLVITSYGLLVAHIGDGRACYCNENGEWKACIEPYKGEYVNETVFVTSDFWEADNLKDYIESRVITEKIMAFAALTDGMEMVCFELNKYNEKSESYELLNQPHDVFFNHNVATLRTYDEIGMTENEINDLWAIFLTNGNAMLSTEPDDKTMILATRIEVNDDNTEIN